MKDSSIVTGDHKRIAYKLERSPRTTTYWMPRGLVPASKGGPSANSLLHVRVPDFKRIKGLRKQPWAR